MGTVLLNRLDSASGEGEGEGLFEFGDVDALLLQVGIAAAHAARVEFGSTSPVGVASTHLRALL